MSANLKHVHRNWMRNLYGSDYNYDHFNEVKPLVAEGFTMVFRGGLFGTVKNECNSSNKSGVDAKDSGRQNIPDQDSNKSGPVGSG